LPTTVFIQQPLPFSWEALSRFRTHEQVYVQAAQQVTHLSALRARAVAVQTPTMQRWVMRDFALPERRVVVVPPDPGAALALSPKPRAGRRILYVGSTSAHKNVDCLGQAKRILEQRYPDLQVAVSLPKEHALVQRYAFEPLGYMSQEQLSLEYERATVLVLPAFVETVGLPLLEAMRHGCPVVVADRPYAFDVCGDAALRFDPNVPVNLARTLEQIWQEPAATAERVQMGLQRIRAQHARGGYAQLIELAIRA
jgi:glycosyltransferase involved in cell wall biosynthesis